MLPGSPGFFNGDDMAKSKQVDVQPQADAQHVCVRAVCIGGEVLHPGDAVTVDMIVGGQEVFDSLVSRGAIAVAEK